jgi:hypothetical protein
MRNFCFILGILIFGLLQISSAQVFKDPWRYPEQNQMMGGLGITWIDDQAYTTLTLAPDIALGKIGVGLYLQFLFNNQTDFKLRTDEFDDPPGFLRVIRYVRYGQKYDPFYARFGWLYGSSLANGFLMWNYTNSSNYDKRKLGLVADFDFNTFGIETIYSNFSRLEIVGGNLYFRPFRLMSALPFILKNLRIYSTYIYDDNIKTIDSQGNSTTEVLRAYGLGTDLQWLNLPVLKSFLYAEYGKFVHYGQGKTIGISAVIPELIGVFGMAARLERRWLGEKFIPNFFGPLHELNRNIGVLVALDQAPKTKGVFGELSGHIIHKLLLIGNYQYLDDLKNSGRVHLEASAPELIPKFRLRAYYDKGGIETWNDLTTLDNRSLAVGEIGYNIYPYVYLMIVYQWYWVEERDNFGNVEYRPVERVEPRISFSFNF